MTQLRTELIYQQLLKSFMKFRFDFKRQILTYQ